MSRVFRRTELKARRTRRQKLGRLRALYATATTARDKAVILEKAQKVSAGLLLEQFVNQK